MFMPGASMDSQIKSLKSLGKIAMVKTLASSILEWLENSQLEAHSWREEHVTYPRGILFRLSHSEAAGWYDLAWLEEGDRSEWRCNGNMSPKMGRDVAKLLKHFDLEPRFFVGDLLEAVLD